MATTLNHEIGSLVDCTRELVRTILSKQQPYYPVEVRVDCNDGNLSGVLFAKTLIQLCTQRIEEMVLDIYRVLLDSGYCGIRSFVTRVAGPISLIHCRNDVINSVAYIKKRNCELEREAMAFSGCSVVNTQYGSKLRLRIQVLETENNDLQSIWKQCELQLKECQTKIDKLENEVKVCRQTPNLRDEELITSTKEREELLTKHLITTQTGELEKEAVGLKQRLKLKDEELITMKKEKEDLLTRNGQLIKEAMGFKQRTEKEKGELLARTGELIKEAMGFKQRIEKEKGELYARTGELEKEAVGLKQRLDLKDEKLLVIQKEREELSRWNDVLEKEVFEFKQRRHLRDEELIAIKKRKAELLVRTEELEKEVTIFKQMLNFKEEELIAINQQKEDLLTRLSQYTSAQMVHDNPNVADLSDLNRPTKLAEKLSELYDNEWTDGFEVLTENYKFTETDAIQQLLDILMDAYTYCTNISNKQAEMMKQALLTPVADYTGEDQQTELNNVQLRNIFDLRKQTSHRSLTTVQKGFLDNIRISGQKPTDVTQIIKYINQCVELCWHMVIRSPPLVFEAPASKGSEFDKTKYRFYQTSGTNLKFIVWPVLRLHENGSLLSKGIAEAMKGDAVLTADLN